MRLNEFAGEWAIARTIIDRAAGQEGHFTGTARLTPDGARLIYDESGELRLGAAAPLRAERRYIWRTEGEEIAVLFADGRPFHRFRAEGQGDGTPHPCGDDLYRVTYDLRDWPRWTALWEVAGPRKDYTMSSAYRPAGQAQASTVAIRASPSSVR